MSSIFKFYLDGFRNLTIGKTLWKLLIIKLLVIFFIIKLIFFTQTLYTKFNDESVRQDFVANNLTKEAK
jgi:hypothetical protein